MKSEDSRLQCKQPVWSRGGAQVWETETLVGWMMVSGKDEGCRGRQFRRAEWPVSWKVGKGVPAVWPRLAGKDAKGSDHTLACHSHA